MVVVYRPVVSKALLVSYISLISVLQMIKSEKDTRTYFWEHLSSNLHHNRSNIASPPALSWRLDLRLAEYTVVSHIFQIEKSAVIAGTYKASDRFNRAVARCHSTVF